VFVGFSVSYAQPHFSVNLDHIWYVVCLDNKDGHRPQIWELAASCR